MLTEVDKKVSEAQLTINNNWPNIFDAARGGYSLKATNYQTNKLQGAIHTEMSSISEGLLSAATQLGYRRVHQVGIYLSWCFARYLILPICPLGPDKWLVPNMRTIP